MVALTGFEVLAVAFVVVLSVVIIALLVYLLRRLRSRRQKLMDELDHRPAATQDRAFNRLAMARRESKILSDYGVDVHRAQELIAQSQGAFDNQNFERSYELAQSAHEALVTARQQGARTTDAPLASSPSLPRTGGGPPGDGSGPAATVPEAAALPETPKPTIPKNRAESQFQIRLLTEELAALPPKRAREPTVVTAAKLSRQASEAFDQGNFTDAFRLALRGRRSLGGNLESLPPSGAPSAPRPAPGAGNGTAPNSDLAQTAETVAGGERCPECGYPTLSGDAFCRGCGRPHAALTCPSCGSARAADEPFCGRCGTRFS